MEQQWLFVGGPVRSGTTITAWALSQHPKVLLTDETHFVTDIAFLLSAADEEGLTKLAGYPRAMRMGKITQQHKVDAYEVGAAMASGLRSLLGPETTYFGDKSPQYAKDWPMLRTAFPECKLIFTDRDTDDCAESILRQEWGAATHERAVEVIEEFREEMHKCPFAYFVQLEDLNDEPWGTILEMLDWLGLDDGVYPWDRAIKQVVDPDEKIN